MDAETAFKSVARPYEDRELSILYSAMKWWVRLDSNQQRPELQSGALSIGATNP